MIEDCIRIYSVILHPLLDFFGILLGLCLCLVVARLVMAFIREVGK